MAVVIGDAAIRLRPEASGFSAEADSELGGELPGVAKKAAGYFAAAFAAVKVGEFLKDAVVQASDLNESASKVGVVFGSMSGQVQAFAAHAAATMGMSQQQALEATGTFGNLAVSLGLGQKQSADMSTSFVKLAGDLASFNNVDPAQALDALRSGLTGETEPLKQFGVNLNQAAIQQEAVNLGLAKGKAPLTAAAQAQAAYSLIMKQTATAQGDFARTSSGLANSQRIISAQFTDLKANVGAAFLPFVNLGANGIAKGLMPALLSLTRPLADVGAGIGQFGSIMHAVAETGDASAIIQKLGPGLQQSIGMSIQSLGFLRAQFVDAFNGGDVALAEQQGGLARYSAYAGQIASYQAALWHDAFAEFRTGASNLGASESPLIHFALVAGDSFRSLRQSATADWMSIKSAALDAVTPSMVQGITAQLMSLKAGVGVALAPIKGQFAGAFSGLEGVVSGAMGGAGGALGGITDKIMGAISSLAPKVLPLLSGLVDRLLGVFNTVGPIIGQTLGALLPIVSTVFGQLGPLIGQVLPIIEQVAGLWRGVLLGAIQALLPVLPTIVAALGQLITTLVGGLGPILSQLGPLISTVVTAFQGALVSAIGMLVPLIPPLIGVLTQVANILVGALLGALQAIMPVLPSLVTLFAQVAEMIGGALSSVLQALMPLLPPIIQALMTVAQALLGALMGALQAILPVIPQLLNVLIQLVQAALIPLLPILPLLANLFATIISALAPIIPVIVQVAAMLIQLVVAALMPLMPIIMIAANLFSILIQAIIPIIQILITVAGAVIGFGATIVGAVASFVGTVLGIWSGMIGAVTSIFGSIFGVIRGVFSSIFGFVSGMVSSIAGAISGAFSGVGGAISRVFGAVGNAVEGAFSGAVNAVKGAINGVIGLINSGIGFINHDLIDNANKVPFVSIPHIPTIPRLHSGGEFVSGSSAGEGLALLRDHEVVVTPEQRSDAAFLSGLYAGSAAGPGPAAGGGGGGVQITNNITQMPGESGSALASRVVGEQTWNLNNGATRRVGVGVPV